MRMEGSSTWSSSRVVRRRGYRRQNRSPACTLHGCDRHALPAHLDTGRMIVLPLQHHHMLETGHSA